jgi:hypothetical protein
MFLSTIAMGQEEREGWIAGQERTDGRQLWAMNSFILRWDGFFDGFKYFLVLPRWRCLGIEFQ